MSTTRWQLPAVIDHGMEARGLLPRDLHRPLAGHCHVALPAVVTPALQTIVSSLEAAAGSVAEIQLYTVGFDEAGKAAQAMALPLRQLSQLRQSLLMRSR